MEGDDPRPRPKLVHPAGQSWPDDSEPPPRGEEATVGRVTITAAGIDVARWLGRKPPELEWVVESLFPRKVATLLTSEGGAGKTMLEQTACMTVATGLDLFGLRSVIGNTAGLFAEDADEVLHGRHGRICAELEIDEANLSGRCHVASWFGLDAVLWRDSRPTPFFAAFEAMLAEIPALAFVPIDNSALVYGGDESDRTEVTRFMAALNGLANRRNVSLVLSAHKSKSNDGTTLRASSGSTAWVNAARHVLQIEPQTDEAGPVLSVIKSNCAKPGESIQLGWRNGVLVAAGPPGSVVARIDGARIDRAIFETIREGWARKAPCSSSHVSRDRYLAALVAAKGVCPEKQARRVMMTMLANGVIANTERRSGQRPSLYVVADQPVPVTKTNPNDTTEDV